MEHRMQIQSNCMRYSTNILQKFASGLKTFLELLQNGLKNFLELLQKVICYPLECIDKSKKD